MELDQSVREILTNGLYREIERIHGEVMEVIGQYPGLQPMSDNFIYNDGSEQRLLKLSGTLPVLYKGTIYNIPIDIWFLNTYPYNAPMVLVTPTPEMRIKTSNQVMADGRVKLPYLQEWKHNVSELMMLIDVLIITFQEEPPVYSVQFNSPQSLSPYHSSQEFFPMLPTTEADGIGSMDPSFRSTLTPERLELLQAAAERLVRRLYATYTMNLMEQKNDEQLRERGRKLESLIQRLESEKEAVKCDIERYEEECSQLSETFKAREADIEDRERNIEDAVSTPRPLFRQIVETNAEEIGIQDAIYYVSEAFRAGHLELDQFEKSIRKLARRQFMLRLLLTKCREKAGLWTFYDL